MKLIRVEKAAPILDVSVPRAYELVRTNVIPRGVYVRLGRQVRIDEDALREWILAGGQALPGGWRREPDERASLPTLEAPPRPARRGSGR